MNSLEIRNRWLKFFESGNSANLSHTVVPSASLILNDPNLLLVNAGMVPFKPYFLGEATPPYKRATSIQKCVRTLDIEEVGKTTRHASFFQMCGNFSFGDYFKEGAIELAWELLTKSQRDGGFGFAEEKLWVTVFHDDDEAANIWEKKIGIPKTKIQRRGMADNFWSMGVPGPCGPCSEIYFDRGPDYGKDGGPIADEDRYLEIWNLVFMQNLRGEGGGKDNFPILGELPAKNIDTGMGLERTAALLQGVDNIYEIDTTAHILGKASSLSGVAYGKSKEKDVSLRVVADHARTATMLIGDGVTPGNEGRGYVLRRMMRRTIRNMRLLGAPDKNMSELITAAIEAMSPQYPELVSDRARIVKTAIGEEEIFLATLRSGTQIFDMAVEKVKKNKEKVLSGDDAFRLHDTYGFPLDLTLEMAQEQGLEIDRTGFERLMKEQKERAKTDSKSKRSAHADLSEYKSLADSAKRLEFVGYTETKIESHVVGLLVSGKRSKSAKPGDEVELVLERTPFYAEGGGQLSDHGLMTTSTGAVIEIDDVQTPISGLIVHRGVVRDNEIKSGESVLAAIDNERRVGISRAHTATHMVHKAFREILGETATQAGSENAPGRFRFDFPATGAVPKTVLEDVELRVNSLLEQDLEVSAEEMSQAEAKALGAMALFGEKYGERVRVISVGDWAKELCGGTHVNRSGQLGLIKLLSESSIGAGVRRIEALVGVDAFRFLAREHLILNSVTELIKGTRSEELPERISSLLQRVKELEKELKAFRTNQSIVELKNVVAQKIGDISLISHKFSYELGAEELRSVALSVREQTSKSIVVLSAVQDGRVILVVATDENSRNQGLKAGELVKLASNILGGGGGGKDDFAQGGGPEIAKLDMALSAIADQLKIASSRK
ncbi:MAG: alanine--tRNA ligase [Actinomycetales bacterium]